MTHDLNDIRCITFKQNHNVIHLVNNYCLKIPYFGCVQSRQSLTRYKHNKIKEVRVKQRRLNDYELQVVIGLKNQKHLTKKQGKNIVSLDVNLKDNKFFDLSNGQVFTWPKSLAHQYKLADSKARYLQHIITIHNHGNDDCNTTKLAKCRLYRLKAKTGNKIDEWQLHVAHQFARRYPVFAMEHLSTFTMRMSKRDKRYKLRKNTNHKLATLHPTKFRKQMEDVYQDERKLLIEVNPIDTSKTCHHCGNINHGLGLQKLWKCPICKQWIKRDPNATYNIRDWAVSPQKHAVLRQPKRYPYLQNPQDLVEYI